MNTNRRKFLSVAALGGLAAPALSLSTRAAETAGARRPAEADARKAKIDAALAQPVLKKALFSSPIIIESLELLRLGNNFLCRVRSKDGAVGVSVAHSTMSRLYPLFLRNLQPFFLGKDARELDLILEKVFVYGFNFRYNGISLGIPLATIEFAILDLLGRVAGLPVPRLVGEIHHPQVPVYVATEWRERPLAESFGLIRDAVAQHDVQALKIKVGYLMFMTTDMRNPGPIGKTERLIPMVREAFGDGMTLYADANSYYDVKGAIRVGRILQENKFAYFEEPVMYDHFEDIKAVADALELPIANGEQDQSFVNFRWLLANEGLDVVQPDNYYFGGLIRSMKVARMAAACGKEVIPHMSGGGLGYVYNIQFAAAMPNAGAHHEFKGFRTHVPFECKTSPLKIVKGSIPVPSGPGWGVDIDPDFIRKHEVVKA
jgi:L-alanine-DL-glutamate epimerase-like enolase superfamily enzyme